MIAKVSLYLGPTTDAVRVRPPIFAHVPSSLRDRQRETCYNDTHGSHGTADASTEPPSNAREAIQYKDADADGLLHTHFNDDISLFNRQI